MSVKQLLTTTCAGPRCPRALGEGHVVVGGSFAGMGYSGVHESRRFHRPESAKCQIKTARKSTLTCAPLHHDGEEAVHTNGRKMSAGNVRQSSQMQLWQHTVCAKSTENLRQVLGTDESIT